MSNYSYKRGETAEYGLIPEGDYECVIDKANLAVTPSGKEKISIQFKIRSDVEQSFVNRVVFDDIWKLKDGSNSFNTARMFKILDYLDDIPEEIEFEDINAYCDLITGHFIRCHIVIDTNNWNGETKEYNSIRYFMKTKSPAQTVGTPIKVEACKVADDEDLPF